MSMLSEQEYEEYILLLRAWVDAENALEGRGEPPAEASQRAQEARAAVQGFRARHGLERGAPGPPEPATVRANVRGRAEA